MIITFQELKGTIQLYVKMKPMSFKALTIISLTISCLLALAPPLGSSAMTQQSETALSTQQNPLDFRITSDKGVVKVPFELYGNNILLQVRINNSQPVLLIFDTGANVNAINQRLFNSLGLSAIGQGNLAGAGGTVQGRFAEGTTISLPGVEAYQQLIASAPLDDMSAFSGRDIQGLLGTPFIKNFVLEIDYAKETISFYDPKVYNLKDSREALALEDRGGFPFVEVELSLNGRDTIKDKFCLDTGSDRIFLINEPFAEAHKLLSILPKAKMTEGVGEAIGGKVNYTEARINSIRIGKYIINKPVLSIFRDRAGVNTGTVAGLIGGEIFRRFTVTLDYQSGKMLLKPNAHFKEPYEIDMSGLGLVIKADDFKAILIRNVRANTPAAAAGLREGDVIVSINGHPAAEFDLDKLSKLFKQSGKTYLLMIKRNDQVISAKLRLKRLV